MVTCVPGLVGVAEGCSPDVGGIVPGVVVGVAICTAVPRPLPEALASAASTGPIVEVLVPAVCIIAVGAGTTCVVVLRDATVLVPGVPTANAVVVPCVPVTGAAGVPSGVPWVVCCVTCTCVCGMALPT